MAFYENTIITKQDLPISEIKTFNDFQNRNTFIVSFSDKMIENCSTIRSFLFTYVYNHKKLLEKRNYSKNVVNNLFEYFKNNNNKLPLDWRDQNIEIERLICDYISGMTDRFAIKLFKEINK